MTSTHRSVLALLCVAAIASVALPASADQTPIINSVSGRQDNAVTNLKDYPINAAECGESPVISIQFRNIPDKGLLDFWRGTAGINCNDTANRDNSQGGDPKCTHLTPTGNLGINGLAQKTLEFPIKELLDANDDGDCDAATADYVIYVLAVDAAASAEEAGENWSFNLSVDTVPPDAPTNVKGGSGNTQISVSWKAEAAQLRDFRLYGQAGACVNGEYVGRSSDGGTDEDDDAGTNNESGGWTVVKSGIPGTAMSDAVSGSALGLDYDEEGAVAVSARDLAGNEGELSEPACVKRVRTEGFCSAQEAGGGKCESCSVRAAGAHTEGGPVVWVVLGLALMLGARRGRRA